MMKRLRLLAWLALATPLTAHAQVHAVVLSDADQATLSQVSQYLNGMRALKGRFLQTGADGKTAQGTVWLERPGRMRFEYDPPSPLLLVAGNGKVIFHDAKLDQVSEEPLTQTPLSLLLADKISLAGDVAVTDFQRLPGQVQITLVRTKTPGDGSLTLILNATPLALVGWSVVDAQGQETRLRLSDMKPGGSFDSALFTYADPDDGK